MPRPAPQSRGVTLVELLVVLVLMSVMLGLSLPLLTSAHRSRPSDFEAARVQAARGAAEVRITSDSGATVLYLPDGQAIGPGIDPLTGERGPDAQ